MVDEHHRPPTRLVYAIPRVHAYAGSRQAKAYSLSIVDFMEPMIYATSGPFLCVVVIGFDATTDTVMSVAETCGPLSYTQVHAITEAMSREQQYLYHRIDFRQPPPPGYPILSATELQRVGTLFDIEVPVCAVVCNIQGEIAIGRQYFCTEHTRLERTYEQLIINTDAVRKLTPPGPARI